MRAITVTRISCASASTARSENEMSEIWTAPAVDEPKLLYVAQERDALENWLDFHRTVLLHKCAGLSSDQRCIRASPPLSPPLLRLVPPIAPFERTCFLTPSQ